MGTEERTNLYKYMKKDYRTNIVKARRLLSEVSNNYQLSLDEYTGKESTKESQIVKAINLLEELL